MLLKKQCVFSDSGGCRRGCDDVTVMRFGELQHHVDVLCGHPILKASPGVISLPLSFLNS